MEKKKEKGKGKWKMKKEKRNGNGKRKRKGKRKRGKGKEEEEEEERIITLFSFCHVQCVYFYFSLLSVKGTYRNLLALIICKRWHFIVRNY